MENNQVTLGELSRRFEDYTKKKDALDESMSSDIKTIKENHLFHIEADVREIQTNLAWLLKYHWIIATASIGGLCASLANLIR